MKLTDKPCHQCSSASCDVNRCSIVSSRCAEVVNVSTNKNDAKQANIDKDRSTGRDESVG